MMAPRGVLCCAPSERRASARAARGQPSKRRGAWPDGRCSAHVVASSVWRFLFSSLWGLGCAAAGVQSRAVPQACMVAVAGVAVQRRGQAGRDTLVIDFFKDFFVKSNLNIKYKYK